MKDYGKPGLIKLLSAFEQLASVVVNLWQTLL